jgi:hypothetical protein
MKARLTKRLWITFAVLVFGPFALIYAFGFVGMNIAAVPAFGTWFMFALSACGVITCIDLIVTGIRNRFVEWFPLIIVGGATFWWLRIAMKPFL